MERLIRQVEKTIELIDSLIKHADEETSKEYIEALQQAKERALNFLKKQADDKQ